MAFYGVVFPRTILRVLQIRYSDFRLEPRRGENRWAEVHYWEAAALVLRLYLGGLLTSVRIPGLRIELEDLPV